MRRSVACSSRQLFLLLAYLCAASCRSSVTTTSRSMSPGGEYSTTLEVKDCGAGCSPSATVTLHDVENRIGKGDIEVFDGVGGWPIEVHWAAPKSLVITFCDGNRYKVRNDISESRIADEGGQWDQIKVMIVTDEHEMIGGRAYCLFPDVDPKVSK